uniref:Uncharacterized protein n=1 Tax=Knipowitschia caucasica TaxID=637954 RepID=A0AAV2LG78_KNICA
MNNLSTLAPLELFPPSPRTLSTPHSLETLSPSPQNSHPPSPQELSPPLNRNSHPPHLQVNSLPPSTSGTLSRPTSTSWNLSPSPPSLELLVISFLNALGTTDRIPKDINHSSEGF